MALANTPTVLLDQRARAWQAMESILDTCDAEHRDLTEKELREYESFEHQVDALSAIIGQRTGSLPDVATTQWHPKDEAFRSYLRSGDETELRAQGVGSGSAGGYMVPTGFRQKVTETRKAFGGIRKLAEIVPTDDGANLPWPTNDDTSNSGAILAENTQASEQDVTLGTKTLGSYLYHSKLVRVSIQLLQQSAFDVDTFLARKLGERVGRAQAVHWATGTGSSQPQGLVTGAATGKTAASATAITADELLDLVASVDPAYLEEPGAVAWIMNVTTLTQLRKLKDSNGHYLIEPNPQAGAPFAIFGYPVQIDQALASPATGTKPIVFGNIRAAYVIREVNSFEAQRLVERYADYLQQGFHGWHQADGLVQDSAAAKSLVMA